MSVKLYWHNYDYFPYERELAKKEVESLFSNVSNLTENEEYLTFSTADNGELPSKIRRLTYFRGGGTENHSGIPIQAKLEAGEYEEDHLAELPGIEIGPKINRQQTRYSAHGIHEYKGKFNPQVVRALGNILGIEPGDWVLDPFCGSGTTLLECKHNGWNGVGIEINPLAVSISNAKIASLELDFGEIDNHTTELLESLEEELGEVDFSESFTTEQKNQLTEDGWRDDISGYDYLKDWFTESVLVQLWLVNSHINEIEPEELRLVFEIILSDIIRDVSLQDTGDLRTRKEDSPPENRDVVTLFRKKLESHLESVSRAISNVPSDDTNQQAVNLDTRSYTEELDSRIDGLRVDQIKFDGAVTSPPYATALPYVDTHRLSLIFLDLVEPSEIRDAERGLIGTRNIKKSTRDRLYEDIDGNTDSLPEGCISLCRRLKSAVDPEDDGFRRKNKPGLVYRYLRDMKGAFKQTKSVLREGAPFAMIVGPNETKLGGEKFSIDNPNLLREIGESVGFSTAHDIELDTHPRFNMHNSNHSIDSERLLVLQK